MYLIRLALLLLVVWIVVHLVRTWLRRHTGQSTTTTPAQDIVPCVVCGVHVPRSSARARDGAYY